MNGVKSLSADDLMRIAAQEPRNRAMARQQTRDLISATSRAAWTRRPTRECVYCCFKSQGAKAMVSVRRDDGAIEYECRNQRMCEARILAQNGGQKA